MTLTLLLREMSERLEEIWGERSRTLLSAELRSDERLKLLKLSKPRHRDEEEVPSEPLRVSTLLERSEGLTEGGKETLPAALPCALKREPRSP